MPQKKSFTPAEFASIVGVDRTTVWRHVKAKLLPVTKGRVTDSTLADVMHYASYAVYVRKRKKLLAVRKPKT